MKTKILSSFLLTLVLSLAMISAVDLISVSKGPSFSQSVSQSYFDITALTDTTVNMTIPSLIRINDGNNNYMTVTLAPSAVSQALTSGTVLRVNASVVVDANFVFQTKTYNFPVINITASKNVVNSSGSTIIQTDSKTVTLDYLKTFCKYGENGTVLSISEVNINNADGDDTEWGPLDSVKIEVKVENNGNEKVKEVNVELGLIDSDGKNIVRDLENLDNKKIDLSSISDGDDKTATFEFLVPPDFADESYKLVIKAYSDDLGEKALCTSSSSDLSDKYFQSIDGVREDAEENHIVLNDMVLSSATAQCGEKVQLSAEIYNIGDEDYEDQVKVTLFNKELNINMEQVVREDFDQGDSAPVDFEFNIPAAAKEKSYTLELKTYYDYKSNSDSYDIQSEKRFIQSITVLGNCQSDVSASDLRITAELDSQTPEATAGKEVIVDAQLKNIGVSQGTWVLSAIGNSEWSSLVSIEPQTLTLNAGETKAVSIKLALDKEASGEKEFTIRAISGSKVTEQRANLSIKAVSSSGFAEHMKANWFIYVIVLVNVILIIAIIAVIRRIVGSRDYQ